MSEVISSFKSLGAGSRVFAVPVLFICVILHTMWSGKTLQLLCILPFGILCSSAIRMMFVKNIFAKSVYVGGYCGLSESGICVFGELCPVGSLVVCKNVLGLVVNDVQLYSVLDTAVIYGEDVCWSVVFGVFSVMWSKLLMTSAIIVVFCGHQWASAREWSVRSNLR